MNYLNDYFKQDYFGGTAPQENNPYEKQLQGLLTNPGSFQGTPGFQFAFDTGLEGVNRQLAARGMTGSGNQLAEIMKYGTGLAQQDYGNQVDRLGRFSGQQQQYNLGNKQADNSFTLGVGQNANTAQRNAWDFNLGQNQNEMNAAKNYNQYNLDSWGNSINQQNANTQLGNARANDFYRNRV